MTPKQIAELVAEELFTTGFGERAVRLVLIDDSGRGLGGWNRSAVEDRVLTILKAASAAPVKATTEPA